MELNSLFIRRLGAFVLGAIGSTLLMEERSRALILKAIVWMVVIPILIAAVGTWAGVWDATGVITKTYGAFCASLAGLVRDPDRTWIAGAIGAIVAGILFGDGGKWCRGIVTGKASEAAKCCE